MTRDKAAELAATICAARYNTEKYDPDTFQQFFRRTLDEIIEVVNQKTDTPTPDMVLPNSPRKRGFISRGITK